MWNEILEVPAPSYVCSVAINCVASNPDKNTVSDSEEGTASFEILLNDNFVSGFSDVWLTAPHQSDCSHFTEIPESLNIEDAQYFRLRISCSFNRELILEMQQGLRPYTFSTCSGPMVYHLLPNLPLIYRIHMTGAKRIHETSTVLELNTDDLVAEPSDCALFSGRDSPAASLSSVLPNQERYKFSAQSDIQPCSIDGAQNHNPAPVDRRIFTW